MLPVSIGLGDPAQLVEGGTSERLSFYGEHVPAGVHLGLCAVGRGAQNIDPVRVGLVQTVAEVEIECLRCCVHAQHFAWVVGTDRCKVDDGRALVCLSGQQTGNQSMRNEGLRVDVHVQLTKEVCDRLLLELLVLASADIVHDYADLAFDLGKHFVEFNDCCFIAEFCEVVDENLGLNFVSVANHLGRLFCLFLIARNKHDVKAFLCQLDGERQTDSIRCTSDNCPPA